MVLNFEDLFFSVATACAKVSSGMTLGSKG
jgi:hypothetical protein